MFRRLIAVLQAACLQDNYMKTKLIIVALVTLLGVGALAHAQADSQKTVLGIEDAPVAVLLREDGEVAFYAFLEPGETPSLLRDAAGITLRIAKGDRVTGEFELPEQRVTLRVTQMPRETIAPGIMTQPPQEAELTVAASYSVAYCQYDQSCVQTRMDEGCDRCIEHWAKTGVSTSLWTLSGCDEAHWCQVLAGNPGGPWNSGWRCQTHTNPFPWNLDVWTELWRGQSVWATDNGPYALGYFWSRYC